jgi:rod shape-determining protein MreD
MSLRARGEGIVLWSSVALGVVLAVIALPAALLPFKPFWLALLVVYWALESPERMSLRNAFLLGLLGDLVVGNLIGEQALRLAIIAFIVLRLRARMRFFPMLQQTLLVLALLVNDRIVILMVRAFQGVPAPDWTFWIAPATGTLLWPWLFLLLDLARARVRPREG